MSVGPRSDSGDAETTQASSEAGDPSQTIDVGAPIDPLPPLGRTLGRYVLGQPVGSGAMGTVHRAFDPELERYVAVKVLEGPGAIDGLTRERFLREARALARIEHPHVVAVHDVGVASGRAFIAMEFVKGGDLKQWLAGLELGPARPWREVLRRYVAAAEGLAAAHAAGLVHRDFKPANVLLRENGHVLVSDFGLVRETTASMEVEDVPRSGDVSGSSTLTLTGAVLGTPAYMAPELFHGRAADERSDQFAFCVAAWEGLSGQRPFAPFNTSELHARVAKAPPELPDDAVPRALYRILQRGLSTEPQQRYPSMDALLCELRAHLKPRAGPLRWALLGAGSVGVLAAFVAVSVWPDPADPSDLSPPSGVEPLPASGVLEPPPAVEPPPPEDRERAVRDLDAQVAPYEKGGLRDPQLAQWQLERALAYLQLWEESGEHRHLRIAHELLLRVRDDEYRVPRSEPLQARAREVLAELHADPGRLADAGIALEPPTRFALSVLRRHGEGSVVRDEFVAGDAGIICTEPCTWAVEVGKGAEMIRVELDGEVVGRAAWNPQRPLDSPASF